MKNGARIYAFFYFFLFFFVSCQSTGFVNLPLAAFSARRAATTRAETTRQDGLLRRQKIAREVD